MRDSPSFTAAIVAAGRSMGRWLPREAQLVDDPYGAWFAGAAIDAGVRAMPGIAALPLWPFVLYMQVRTRVIDDVVRAFLDDGGTQLVVLGAGFDSRGLRFANDAPTLRVFEIDHPATQARKRAVLHARGVTTSNTSYVPWDFEARPLQELRATLQASGLDVTRKTLTLWEGVTMYLTEPAIDATVRAVASWSSPDAPFLVNYLDRRDLEHPSLPRRFVGTLVSRMGEPFRFGWLPAELPAWMAARGFALTWDRDVVECARTLLPSTYARAISMRAHRLVLLRAQGLHAR
jgi:methyltransferase (TIGR00027 family)